MRAEELLIREFDRLSEAPGAVEKLREFVLQMAVRGHLLEGDPHDRSARRRLAQIVSGQKSVERVAKREVSTPDALPFDLPSHWEVVRLGDALQLVNGRPFKPSEWSKVGVPIIRIQNLNDEGARFNHTKIHVPAKFHVNSGDLLISWSGTPGTSFGAHIWSRGQAVLNQHIFAHASCAGVRSAVSSDGNQ